MTDTQKHEALRLADELCAPIPDYPAPTSLEKAAAAELRRLHDLLGKANALCRIRYDRIKELQVENEALHKALRNLFSYANRLEMNDASADGEHPAMQEARAAMKGQP